MTDDDAVYITGPIADTNLIVPVLERDRCMAAYALADLDPPYRENARFIGAFRQGTLTSVLLLYRLPTTTAILPFGEVSGIDAIFANEPTLPKTAFLLTHDQFVPAVGRRYDIRERWRMDRMVVQASELRSAPYIASPIRRLTGDDIPAIRELYIHWGDTFFDELMLQSGVYCGVYDSGTLVAVSGTHVVSTRRSLACIGGVFTHPEHRGHGFATATTGEVCRILASMGIELIALNVKVDNAPAIAAYARLGFRRHESYIEGHASLHTTP